MLEVRRRFLGGSGRPSMLIRSVAALVTALATRFTARSPFFIHADLRMFRRLVGATGLGATAPGGRLAAPCCGALASFLVCAECGGLAQPCSGAWALRILLR